MITEIKVAYESGKMALDIAKGMHALSTATAINSAVIEIQRNLLDAQNGMFAANEAYAARLKEIDDLKQEIVSLKAWDGEAERYELKRYQPGTLAYALKASMAGSEPPHYLCAKCYGNKKKSFLQPIPGPRISRDTIHICHSCDAKYPIGQEMPSTEAPA